MAIGDIKKSLLNEEQFLEIAGDGWVPLDGRDVTGSAYADQTGMKVIPDMQQGQFVRNVGGSATTMGINQDEDTNKDHLQSVFSAGSASTTDAAHSHFLLINKKVTGNSPNNNTKDHANTWTEYHYSHLPDPMKDPKYRFSASSSSAAKCQVETSAALSTMQIDSSQWNNDQNWTEDEETRPVNVAFYHYIQIN